MIVRSLTRSDANQIHFETTEFASTRLLTRSDALGFSFHISRIFAGSILRLHYRHHLEAVYCIAGFGEVQELETGTVHRIEPGVLYALERHDRHILRARTELELACVFNPALSGAERHDADGAYPPPEDA